MKPWVLAMSAALIASGYAAAQNSSNPEPARAKVTVVTRATTTITGQRLGRPSGNWEVVMSVTDLPAGGVLPMHKHPWPRYAYVERGRLSVTYVAAGFTREFGPGDAVVEAIGQWHEGRVVGTEPVRLVVLDQVPRGATNVVAR